MPTSTPTSHAATGLATLSCPLNCCCSPNERLNCELSHATTVIAQATSTGADGLLFAALPPLKTAEIYGVRYAVFERPDFGQLLVTRYGWPLLQTLMPQNWYEGGAFWKVGQRMGQSTGTVYRMSIPSADAKATDIIIKVSRFAQDVPFYADRSFLEKFPHKLTADLRFNNPFEEFGRLWRLRTSQRARRILTKRPLAIYSPPEKIPLWQHGRESGAAMMEQRSVAGTQEPSRMQIELDPFRSYFSLFDWIEGLDASSLYQAGQLSEASMAQLTADSIMDLMAHGMMVLDHKPAHLILRRTRNGRDWIRRHDGRIAYALVDFELLVDIGT